MIFFGRFRRLSPVTPVADALKVLKNINSEDASNIHIHSFGKPDADNLKLIREYGLENNFIFHEPVVPEKMLPKRDFFFVTSARPRSAKTASLLPVFRSSCFSSISRSVGLLMNI